MDSAESAVTAYTDALNSVLRKSGDRRRIADHMFYGTERAGWR